jgi:hypothetical protein
MSTSENPTSENLEPTFAKVGDTAGVYVPVYLDGIIEAVHDDGSATVRVEGFTLQVLPDDDESERHETAWRYDPFDPARIRRERERPDNQEPGDESGYPAVTWKEWGRNIIDAIRNGPEDRRARAVATLRKLTDYLDEQYDGGYHGIAARPLAECNMGWDW